MGRSPRHNHRFAVLAGALWLLAGSPCAWAQDEEYDPDDIVPVNLVSARVEQLHNAVRITLQADGTLDTGLPEEYYDILESRVTDDVMTRTIDEVPFHLTNARSRIGSFVDVSTYPVSHILITPLGTGNRGIGQECRLVLYRPGGVVDSDMMEYLRALDSPAYRWRWMGVNIHIDIRLSQDERAVVITVNSDQYIDPEAQLQYHQPGPDDEQHLAIGETGDRYTLEAINVPVSRVLEELGRCCGRPLALSIERERWVTTYMPMATVDEIVEALCAGYELSVVEGPAGGMVISEAKPVDVQSYNSNESAMIRCLNISAKDAVNMLPYSLLPYIRIDVDNNAIVVTGSRALADKIRADVATFDVAPPMVQIEAEVIALANFRGRAYVSEAWHTSGNDSVLALFPDSLRFGSGESVGDPEDALFPGMMMFPRETPIGGWSAALAAIRATGASTTIARPRITVQNGHRGDLFVGIRQFIQRERTRRSFAGLQEIGSGIRLTVTPLAGSEGEITLRVELSVSNFVEIADGLDVPSSATRQMEGTLRIRDGDSVIIGGLFQSIEANAELGLPGLQEVELLRKLLGTDSESGTYDDVVYVLTARLVDGGPTNSESLVLLGGDPIEPTAPSDHRPSAADFVRSVRTGSRLGEHQDG
ncbi:MAG: hypothetical protein GF320_14855 [Armatimonadia bacterium]|nr:hypothetical protein [Armatimonadia bacterium]